jgi:hypothetical protein
MGEWGSWVVDGIASSARKMAGKEENEWVAQVENGRRRWTGGTGWAV